MKRIQSIDKIANQNTNRVTIHFKHSFVARATISIIGPTGAVLHTTVSALRHDPLVDAAKTTTMEFSRSILEGILNNNHRGPYDLNSQIEIFTDSGERRILTFRLFAPRFRGAHPDVQLQFGTPLLSMRFDEVGLTVIQHSHCT